MTEYDDTCKQKQRHVKNTNKMRLHEPRSMNEKNTISHNRQLAYKKRMWVKNYKRDQQAYRMMHTIEE